jgi:Ferredoxin-dependent bilin reductase
MLCLYLANYDVRKHMDRYRRINDPARGMLTRYFGADWTEDLIEHVLFDLEHGVQSGTIQLQNGLQLMKDASNIDAAGLTFTANGNATAAAGTAKQ